VKKNDQNPYVEYVNLMMGLDFTHEKASKGELWTKLQYFLYLMLALIFSLIWQ